MIGTTHRLGGLAVGAAIPLVMKLYLNIEIENPLVFVSLTMAGGGVGSIIPDIDSNNSIVGRRFKKLSKFISSKFGHRGGTHTILSVVLFSFFMFFIARKLESFLSSGINDKKVLIFASINSIIIAGSTLFALSSIPNKYRGVLSKRNDIFIIIALTLATVFFTFDNKENLLGYIDIYLLGIVLGYISHIFLDLLTKEGVPLLRPLLKIRFKFSPFRTGGIIEFISKTCSFFIIIFCLMKLLN